MVRTVLALVLLALPASSLELTERQVRLERELTPQSASKVAEELFKLDAAGQEPIVLFINTRSGYAPAAMVVVDAIRSLRSKVHAVIQPEAFGVGAIVAVHCEKRFAFPSATVVFGKVSYDSDKIMKDEPPLPVAAADAYVDRVWASAGKRIGLSGADLEKKAEAGWVLTADEAKAAGVVTDLVDRVDWVELIIETVEVKKTATLKSKGPAKDIKDSAILPGAGK